MDTSGDYLGHHARERPTAIAAVDLTSGRSWTYGQFERAVHQYAATLRAHGITAGDRVAALAKNRVELVLLHLGCAALGAIYVPLNWRLSPAELADIVADAQPALVLSETSPGVARLPAASLDEFAESAARIEPQARLPQEPASPSLILYTSGTTGTPKGVLLSESNLWQTGRTFAAVGAVTSRSAVLCDAPMFHIIGLVANVRPFLVRGGTVVVSDGFAAARTLQRLADPALGITHYFCVPQSAAMLRAEPAFDPASLRGLTAIFSGGAPHAPDAIRAWTADGILMADGFGMSEAGTVSCMPLDLELIERHAGSAGFVPPEVQVRIVDQSGRPCRPGEPGELQLRGNSVTTGYWRRSEAESGGFTEDGWLASGDIARLDADGYLWLVDRMKDMYISGGENVYPAEIEAVFAAHPGITECAVVGVRDDRWGEVGHLVVVVRDGYVMAESELAEVLHSRLARYKIPKYTSVVDKLPRNGAGKVSKPELRRLLESQRSG